MTLNSAEWERLRHAGDPLADRLALKLIENGGAGKDALAAAWRLAAAGDDDAAAFVATIEATPEWVAPERLALGRDLFLRHAPLAMTSFVLGTLPITYAPPGSARVLHYTGRLAADVRRRLFETAVMVREVLRPDAFAAKGPGRAAIARVRLLHATVRQRVRMSRRWDDAGGGPINQLELGLTATGFGCRVLLGLQSLGVRFRPGEAEGYQQLWRFANTLQGVEPILLPSTIEDEQVLYQQFRKQLMDVGEEGQALVASLHAALGGTPPFWLPVPVLQALTCRLIDDDALCDAFRIPRRPGLEAACAGAALVNRLAEWRFAVPGVRRRAIGRGERLFTATIEQGLQAREADFQFVQRGGT